MRFFVLLLTLAASLGAATPAREPRQPRPVGNMVFEGPRGKISMDKYKGKVTVVMFFHTECKHCEETALNLQKAMATRHDFQVVGVSVDENPNKNVAAFVRRLRLTYPIGWVGKDDFYKYTDLPTETRPFIPVLMFIDKDFQVNRQYSQDHLFFNSGQGELSNTLGVVNMLQAAARGTAKDVPRRQPVPEKK